MKRLLFFCHYNKHHGLSEHIIYLLSHIKHIYNRIVFVSNSNINIEKQKVIKNYCDDIQFRENRGYDFGAWKDALLKEGWDRLSEYDNITLMNDTCFGPFHDMEVIYNKMERQNIDFWGITEHRATVSNILGMNRSMPAHIQSYFMCFTNKVIRAGIFRNFWGKVNYERNVGTVILKYEIQLTGLLKKNGFKYISFLEAPNTDNISIMHADFCINNASPFVKIKSFLYFPFPEYLLQLIRSKTSYPVSLIIDYFFEVYNPSITFAITNKVFPVKSSSNNRSHIPLPKIALHLHVFYMDVFEKYVAVFDNWTIKYHLFITTDTLEKKQAIIDYLQNHPSYNYLEEILVFQNHGRDILPWLRIAKKLNNYDIAGHFHTKKNQAVDSYIGLIWLQEIIDLLLVPIDTIVDVFNTGEKIGIIIPDIPRIYQLYPVINAHEKKTMELMNTLWKDMRCKKEIDFRDLFTLIFPYGTMFWYRPSALRPLFELQAEKMKIPVEPLPYQTILHGIERLPVYIAWSEGFDYRISVYALPRVSSFYNNMIINKYHVENFSKDYKVGKLVLLIPRLIKKIIERVIRARKK